MIQKIGKTLRLQLGPWRFYSRFLTAHWKKLAFPIIASAGISLIVLPLAYLVVHLFQEAIPSGSIREVAKTGLVMVFLTFFQGLVAYWIRSSVLSVVKISVEQFRDEVLKRLCAISRSEYIGSNRGELHSKIIHDTEQLDHLGNVLLVQIMPALAVIVPLSFALIWLNWYLFLISFMVFPVMIYLGKIIGRRIGQRAKTFRSSLHSFSTGILFTLDTMDLARIQSAEEFELQRQRLHVSKVREEGRYLAKVTMTYQLVQSTVSTSFSFLVLVIGGIAVIQGFFSIASLVSFYVVMTLLKAQVNIIVFLIPTLIQAKDALTEIYNFL